MPRTMITTPMALTSRAAREPASSPKRNSIHSARVITPARRCHLAMKTMKTATGRQVPPRSSTRKPLSPTMEKNEAITMVPVRSRLLVMKEMPSTHQGSDWPPRKYSSTLAEPLREK